MWKVTKDTFDKGLSETYEKEFAAGKWTGNFIKAFRPMLGIFMAPEDLLHMEKSVVQEGVDPDPRVCRRVLSSSAIGASLFAESGRRLDNLVFQQSLKERLDQLEFLDYQRGEVENFRTMLRNDIQALHDGGHSSWENRSTVVEVLGSQVKMMLNSLHDDVDFHYMARLEGVAINTRQVPMLPWEAALWEPGMVPKARGGLELPEELVSDILNVRDACRKLIGHGDTTFVDMKKAVSPVIKTLVSLDRTFLLEYTFLCECAAIAATDHVRAKVLDILPGEGRVPKFSQVLGAILGGGDLDWP